MALFNPKPEIKLDGFITPEKLSKVTGSYVPPRGNMMVFACRSGEKLANDVIDSYNNLLKENKSKYILELDGLNVIDHNDTTIKPKLLPHVQGKDVFLFQIPFDPITLKQIPRRSVNDNYMELFLSADNLRFHGAKNISAIIPFLSYARQDKPTAFKREPIAIKWIISALEMSGVSNIILYDPHFPQIIGYANTSRIHALNSIDLFKEKYFEIKSKYDSDVPLINNISNETDEIVNPLTLVSPDAGYARSMELFAKCVNSKFSIGYKSRNSEGKATLLDITGKLKGVKAAIIKDDMNDTGGSFFNMGVKLNELGIEDIYGMFTHGLLNGKAIDNLITMNEKYGLKKVYILETTYHDKSKMPEFIEFISIKTDLAKVINRIHYEQSISELFTKIEK